MTSTLKIDTVTTLDGTGNITFSRPIVADISNVTGTLPAISGSNLTGVGKVVQVVNVQNSTYATGTTLIPNDTSKPLITEGDEYMTLAITPTSTSNKLIIEWEIAIHASNGAAGIVQYSALFNTDSHATESLASVGTQIEHANNQCQQSGRYYMNAHTTSATTFRIRAGVSASATYSFNGAAGGDRHGTSSVSSITITEISA